MLIRGSVARPLRSVVTLRASVASGMDSSSGNVNEGARFERLLCLSKVCLWIGGNEEIVIGLVVVVNGDPFRLAVLLM